MWSGVNLERHSRKQRVALSSQSVPKVRGSTIGWTHKKTANNGLWGILSVRAHMCTCVESLSHGTPWTIVHQAPLSMEFSRQEPETEPTSSALSGRFFTTEPHGKLPPNTRGSILIAYKHNSPNYTIITRENYVYTCLQSHTQTCAS